MSRSRRRPHRKERLLANAGDTLMTALGQLGLTDQVRRIMICQLWSRVVGKQTASHTEPDAFTRGSLRVKASSASWQNELTFLKGEIRQRLNAVLGGNIVKEIRVVAGSVQHSFENGKPAWCNEAPTADDKAIAQSNSLPIGDSELRDSFENLMCLHLRAARHR